METLTAEQKIGRGRMAVYDRFKFFASVVAPWKVTITRQVPTASTNGPELRANPDFVDGLSLAEVHDLMLHEAGHIIFGHHARMGKRDPETYNIAADLALNDRLGQYMDPTGAIRREGLFPGKGRHADLPRGKSAEWYYDKLRSSQPQVPQAAQEPSDDAEPGAETSDSGPGTQAEAEQESEQETETSQDQSEESETGPETGSDGKPTDQEPSGPMETETETNHSGDSSRASWSFGEIEPSPVEDLQEAEQEWERTLARAVNAAKEAGDLPGWAAELADELLGPKSTQNWRAIMRRWLTMMVPTMHRYDRPARRTAWRTDLIFPAVGSKEAPPGCVLTDTSSSMDLAAMNVAISELQAFLTTFAHCEVTLRQADTRLIDSSRTFHRWDFPMQVPVEWQGRGGTDLSGAIAEIAADRRFKWIAVVSDMRWTVSACPDPGVPVLWITTEDIKQGPAYRTPTFGEVIGPVAA